MCGINGICGYGKHPVENITRMNERLFRRGPDSGGYWTDEKAGVILGHRRLSILELSESGTQPMVSRDGRYVIVYNGEIYNYRSLKRKMQEDGIVLKLRGESDTEVLLEAFAAYGVRRTLEFAKGMFAFALYDRQEKTLILARDRMGEKPLYYGRACGSFVFSSDLSAIRALDGFDNQVDKKALGLYFRYGYIPQPYSVYENIQKLPPGEILTVRAPYTEWERESYWDIAQVAERGQADLFKGTEEEAAEELEKLLKNAIREQMVADVPVGAFLSGGIDSTLVVSLMQSLSKEKVRTFTIGFKEDAYNEAVYAREEAAHLNTRHTELYVGICEVMDVLPHMAEAYAEPFADTSQIPTLLVSRMTREQVTVSLSGDGGDELFCGYNTYKDLRRGLAIARSKAGFLPHGFRRGIGAVCKKMSGAHTPLLYKVGNCFTIDTPEDYYRGMVHRDCKAEQIVRRRGYVPCSNTEYPDGLLSGGENNLMLMDMLQYLPDDILVKVDRAGMYYSLESRIPLLDRDVVEFSWRLPLSYKYDGNETKRPLRSILYRYVPRQMMERPKKGFSLPVDEWLKKGDMREWAESVRADARAVAGEFIDLRIADSLWDDLQKKNIWQPCIWYVLMFEQWLLSNGV